MNKRGAKRKKHITQDSPELHRIGAHIRRLRKAQGYTSHEAFAYAHGFARAQFLSYEHGRNMQVFTLLRIVAAFGMDLETFFKTMKEHEPHHRTED
jgi:transcriptional regulator with XRE-family HTH domain